MRILQVIPYFVPAWDYGGPLRACFELSAELVKRGHQITVYTTDTLDVRGRIDQSQEVFEGIHIKRFRNISNTLAYKHNLYLPLGMILPMKDLGSFDLIHLHEYRTMLNTLVHYKATKAGTPYLIQAHGDIPPIMVKHKLKRLYDIFWGKRILCGASKTIALTQREAMQYKDVGIHDNKIEIIPNGIPYSELEDMPTPGKFRKTYGIGENEKVVLFLARIHRIKQPDLLARSFATLMNELQNITLVIAGPDEGFLRPLRQIVSQLGIFEKVLFTGPLYGQAKKQAFVDANVYVLPSLYETFPISVLEASACGTPVIVTNQCGIADIIRDQIGLVVPPEQESLATAISQLLTNDELAAKLGENGKYIVGQHYTWPKIASQLESLYFNCLTTDN
ncbi:MAG: glycosyltransferase [Chloroflexi bacterium]|nr:glycosyltransferase [Chloroflexota bacterium]